MSEPAAQDGASAHQFESNGKMCIRDRINGVPLYFVGRCTVDVYILSEIKSTRWEAITSSYTT